MEQRREVRAHLRNALGDRLRAVILYGSEARGEAQPDSDVDILVVLQGPIRLGDDVETITRALYPLQRRIPDRPLHALPVAEEIYQAKEYALHRRAHAEGIAI